MSSKKTADSGVWFDHDTGKVVTKQPKRARQLVAPGKEMTADLEAVVDSYKEAPEGPEAEATKKAPTKKAAAKKGDSED